jgi:hypothetical protein
VDKETVVYIHNGKLFSHKKNEILIFEAKCMSLKDIKLSQEQKNVVFFSLIEEDKKVDLIEVESRIVGRAGERTNRRWLICRGLKSDRRNNF